MGSSAEPEDGAHVDAVAARGSDQVTPPASAPDEPPQPQAEVPATVDEPDEHDPESAADPSSEVESAPDTTPPAGVDTDVPDAVDVSDPTGEVGPAETSAQDAAESAAAVSPEPEPEPEDAGSAELEREGAEPEVAEAEDTEAEGIEPADTEPADAEPADAEPEPASPETVEPGGTTPADTEAVDIEPADAQPADAELVDIEPADTQPADTQPADTQIVGIEPVESAPADAAPPHPVRNPFSGTPREAEVEPWATPAERSATDPAAATPPTPATPPGPSVPVRTSVRSAQGGTAATAPTSPVPSAPAPQPSDPVAPSAAPTAAQSTAAWSPEDGAGVVGRQAAAEPAPLPSRQPAGTPRQAETPRQADMPRQAESASSGLFPSAALAASVAGSVTPGPVTADTDPSPGTSSTGSAGVPSSPLDVFESADTRRRWPRVLMIALSVLVVLAGAYVALCYAVGDRVPRGASVAGVEIGGMTHDAAVRTLEEGLAAATTEPFAVRAGDLSGTVDPVEAGLTFDAEATVSQVTVVDLHPRRLWQMLFGVGPVDPVSTVDEGAFDAALGDLEGSLQVAPVDGAIVFADGSPHATPAEDGWKLDAQAASDRLRAQWLTAARPLELTTVPVEPAIGQDETDRALTEARRVTSGPVTVEVADQRVELPVTVLSAAASFVPSGSELTLQMNGPKLVEETVSRTTNLLTAASDAHFEFVDGAPVIVGGDPGTTIDPTALATAVADAIRSDGRTASVELVQTDPAESKAELESLGIAQVVGAHDTDLTSENKRTLNIINGAAKVNGTLVLPGETFSLTEALSPIDGSNGYIEAGVIVQGRHTDGWGGGLSQVSTTVFNAGYLAGFEDIEHKPHSEWFARYPEGREATIYEGQLDMRWKNNTPYGALLQAWVSGNQLHVRIWSTPYWTVTSETGPRTNVVQPKTVYSQVAGCEPQSSGNAGFTVKVVRKVYLGEELKDTNVLTTTYRPQNKIVCGPDPATVTAPAVVVPAG